MGRTYRTRISKTWIALAGAASGLICSTPAAMAQSGGAGPVLRTDINGDGRTDRNDLLLLLSVMASGANATPEAIAGADANGDGALNSLDVSAIVNAMSAPAPTAGTGGAAAGTGAGGAPPRVKRASAPASSPVSSKGASGSQANPPAPPGGGTAGAPVGWTTLTPGPETRITYVSSSTGNDANSGATANLPVRTIAAGVAKLRAGKPDWLLLKRGDTWTETLGNWTKTGKSATEPMVVSVYGTGTQRAFLRTGSTTGLLRAGNDASGGFVAFVGLDMTPHTFTGVENAQGVYWTGAGQHILIEDCKIHGYKTNVIIQGINSTIRNVQVRRNVLADTWATNSHAQGIYMSNVDGILIQENVIDHNGWKEGVTGAQATIFNHNIYLQTSCTPNTQVIGNIISNASSHGVQMRAGGVCEDNLFIRNPIAILVGSSDLDFVNRYATGTIRNNVIIDSRDTASNLARGFGVWLENARAMVIERNLVAHQRQGNQPVAFTFERQYADMQVRNNVVYDWARMVGTGGTAFRFNGTARGGIQFVSNRLQQSRQGRLIEQVSTPAVGGFTYAQNRYFTTEPQAWFRLGGQSLMPQGWPAASGEAGASFTQATFPDRTRDVAKYNRAVGGPETVEAFITEARKQSRGTWRDQYTAMAAGSWIRAGFGM